MKRILIIALLFWSCERFDGPTGPQGEQGLIGEQGITGEQGPSGEDGLPGVANITVSTFSFLSIQIDTSGRGGIYTSIMPQITQEVVDDGVVLVFMQVASFWMPLPVTESFDYNNSLGVNEVIETTYLYTAGELSIFYFTSYNPILLSYLFTGPFKVVIIPPAALAKGIPKDYLSEIMALQPNVD